MMEPLLIGYQVKYRLRLVKRVSNPLRPFMTVASQRTLPINAFCSSILWMMGSWTEVRYPVDHPFYTNAHVAQLVEATDSKPVQVSVRIRPWVPNNAPVDNANRHSYYF